VRTLDTTSKKFVADIAWKTEVWIAFIILKINMFTGIIESLGTIKKILKS